MLDILYRYENGYVVIPVVLACKRRGLFARLRDRSGIAAKDLAAATNANDGHLGVALDMLRTLGWVERAPDGRLTLTAAGEAYREIPDGILELYEADGEAFLATLTAGRLCPWFERCRSRWPGVSAGVRDYLDGTLLVPLFVALAQSDLREALESDAAPPVAIGRAARDAVRALFVDLGFGRFVESRRRRC